RRAGWSPFAGRKVVGWPKGVVLHGNLAMFEDEILDVPAGQPFSFEHDGSEMEILFKRKWEAAHRFIENGSTICAQPHGHTWHVEVTASIPNSFKLDLSSNVYAPFSDLKSKWNSWIDDHVDHSFMY